jgi:hypothetical protein
VVSPEGALANLQGPLIMRERSFWMIKLTFCIANGAEDACNSCALWAHGDLEDLECSLMTPDSFFKGSKLLMDTT